MSDRDQIKKPFKPDMTLATARDVLRPLALGKGAECPCCTQNVKVYRRKLTSVAARAVIALWREHGTDFGHLPRVVRKHMPDVAHQGGYLTLPAHWGLIEDESGLRREDGGRTGYWRVTALGVDWVEGRTAVPAYANVFNGKRLGALYGPPADVYDALGKHFSYSELMRAGGAAPVDDEGQSLLFAGQPDDDELPEAA